MATIKMQTTGSAINNEIGSFQRREDKFLVHKNLQYRILSDIYKEMEPDYLHDDTHYTLIESIYLDSLDLDLFRNHFQTLPTRSRHKLRVRRYGPNGVWNKNNMLLELKKKKEGITKKVRIKISSIELELLEKGLPLIITDNLRTLNEDIRFEALEKRLVKINKLIVKFCLRPVRSVIYKRYAFESNGFRVTMDSDLDQRIIAPISESRSIQLQEEDLWEKAEKILSKMQNQNKCILELKHTGDIPKWMGDLLDEHGMTKESFSKYCYFTAQAITQQ